LNADGNRGSPPCLVETVKVRLVVLIERCANRLWPILREPPPIKMVSEHQRRGATGQFRSRPDGPM